MDNEIENKEEVQHTSSIEVPKAKKLSKRLIIGIVLVISILVIGVLGLFSYNNDDNVEDIAIDQESQAVDSDIDTLDTDLKEVDQAINDQPADLNMKN